MKTTSSLEKSRMSNLTSFTAFIDKRATIPTGIAQIVQCKSPLLTGTKMGLVQCPCYAVLTFYLGVTPLQQGKKDTGVPGDSAHSLVVITAVVITICGRVSLPAREVFPTCPHYLPHPAISCSDRN